MSEIRVGDIYKRWDDQYFLVIGANEMKITTFTACMNCIGFAVNFEVVVIRLGKTIDDKDIKDLIIHNPYTTFNTYEIKRMEYVLHIHANKFKKYHVDIIKRQMLGQLPDMNTIESVEISTRKKACGYIREVKQALKNLKKGTVLSSDEHIYIFLGFTTSGSMAVTSNGWIHDMTYEQIIKRYQITDKIDKDYGTKEYMTLEDLLKRYKCEPLKY